MDPGIGMYAVGALVVLFPAIMVTFDPREIWKRVEWADGEVPPRRCLARPPPRSRRDDGRSPHRRAGRARLLRDVRLLSRPADRGRAGLLPALRRAARVAPPPTRSRTPGRSSSPRRSATSRPTSCRCSTTTTLGSSEPDTIMSGVVFLYTSGSWPLALIVLVASVMIPLGKLVALAYLLITRAARLDRQQPRARRGSIASSSSSAAGRCSTCSSPRSPSRWCSCSR